VTGILYLSYTGMLEPLGQSQVLNYLERLAKGRTIHLVSFEAAENRADAARQEALSQRIAASGIAWHPLRYHKRPSAAATAYDIAQGILKGTRLARRHGLGIIHARSYVASVMALAIKRMTGARFLFDMRGFWADERVDAGLWPHESWMFRIAKRFERRLLLGADAVISLTDAAKQEIATFPYLAGRIPPVTVIPTCADLDRFTPGDLPPRFTLGYVGTVGNWYDFGQSARLFGYLRRQRADAHMMVVNRGEHGAIRAALESEGFTDADFTIRSADHAEVPGLIRRMSAGVLVARPAYSHVARSPTKLAEFLGCGVPCLVSSAIGDTEEIVASNRAGIVIRDFSNDSCSDAISELLRLVADPSTSARCVATAQRRFALEAGVERYAAVYERLAVGRA